MNIGERIDLRWQDKGACREEGVDPELFFHPENESGANKRARDMMAKIVCRRCEVQAECLDYALKTGEVYGVWGGKTEEERRELLKRAVNRNIRQRRMIVR